MRKFVLQNSTLDKLVGILTQWEPDLHVCRVGLVGHGDPPLVVVLVVHREALQVAEDACLVDEPGERERERVVVEI